MRCMYIGGEEGERFSGVFIVKIGDFGRGYCNELDVNVSYEYRSVLYGFEIELSFLPIMK